MVRADFDPMKDEENLRKHGLPLLAAVRVFEGPFIEEVDRRRSYGEPRFVATGPHPALEDRICVVVYSWRGGTRRIISFRKASDREIRNYRDRHA